MTLLFFLLFTAFYIWQIISFAFQVVRLVDMYHFYTHLLHIPDVKISTLSITRCTHRVVYPCRPTFKRSHGLK